MNVAIHIYNTIRIQDGENVLRNDTDLVAFFDWKSSIAILACDFVI